MACIESTWTRNSNGYGVRIFKGQYQYAHRLAWAEANGLTYAELTRSMIICHECDNPACVNPEHLTCADQSYNMNGASKRKRIVNSAKTHCKHGHELTPDNLYTSDGGRKCKICTKRRSRERKERLKHA